MISLENQI